MKKQKHHSTFSKCLFALLLTLVYSCTGDKEKSKISEDGPFKIDLVEAYSNRGELQLSTFVKSIEYISLEANQNALIDGYPSFYLTKDRIISSAFRQLYSFDRTTGRFLTEIKRYGEGPDEYRNTHPALGFNEEDSAFYVSKEPSLIWQLNQNGDVTDKIEIPTGQNYIMGFTKLSDDLFVGYNANPVCEQKNRLTVFNRSGEIIKAYPNPLSCTHDMSNGISFDSSEGQFFRDNGTVYFKETFNDTLFHVSSETISAHLVFDSKNHGIPYEDKTKFIEKESKYDRYQPAVVDVNNEYIFFQLSTKDQTFNGIFSKETREAQLSDLGNTEMHGFANDIDNFLPFVPQYATDNNKLVGYMEAPDVLAWFSENPEKAAKLPPELKQLGKLKMDDNPVVMILNLKD